MVLLASYILLSLMQLLGQHTGLVCSVDGRGIKCQLEKTVVFLHTEFGFHCGGSM